MSDWPSPNDYTVAIQTPRICFKDPDLQKASVERHALTQMPKVWTGNFAQVFSLVDGQNRWAVKCFTRSATNIRQRYAVISAAILASKLRYFPPFYFLDNQVLVNGRRYPIVKMRWVAGQSLDKFVEANLYRPSALLELASQLIRMVKELEGIGIAHGDLQHGNIL